MIFVETSAMNANNVDNIFCMISNNIMKKIQSGIIDTTIEVPSY